MKKIIRVILILIVITGVIFFISGFNPFTKLRDLFASNNTKKLAMNNQPIPTVNMTPSPEPNIQCSISSTTIELSKTNCSKLVNYIDKQKLKDEAIVVSKIDDINTKLQSFSSTPAPANPTATANIENTVMNSCSGDASQVYTCRANIISSLANILAQKAAQGQAYYNMLISERTFYQNYLYGIEFGASGNGACADHGGVNPAAGEGNSGQVICADGWDQSQVYYYNVKECIEYTEKQLIT